MSFKMPTSEVYFMSVPWGKDYKNVVIFDNLTQQEQQISALAGKHFTNVNIIRKDRDLIIEDSIGQYWTYNYMMFRNPEVSNKWWYAFIDDANYDSEHGTRITFTIDVFQTFFFYTTFYNSWIERSHVSKSDDSIDFNLEPEPFSVKPLITRDIDEVFLNADWEPQWVLHCASYYDENGDKKYHYEGVGDGNTFGEYGRYIDTKTQLKLLLEQYGRKSLGEIVEDVNIDWGHILNELATGGSAPGNVLEAINFGTSFADLQDHRDELIGIFAIPKWGRGNTGVWADNNTVNKNTTLHFTNDMACGYEPRNKKLLSSIFKGYILYAANGTLVPYKPEGFSTIPTITCSCIPMGTSKYYVRMGSYTERDKKWLPIQYYCERRVGYDSNTGLNKTLNVLSSAAGVVSGVTIAATSAASENPVGVISGVSQAIGSSVSMIDSLGQIESHAGNNTELLDITDARAALRWADVSPTYNECVHYDKFLDTYGYAQNTIGSPLANMRVRSRWNYLKTTNINLKVRAAAKYEDEMKEIFNNGVTIWRSISGFGDYSDPGSNE